MITHPVLKRQLKRLGLTENQIPTLAQWQEMLALVERTYHHADQQQYLTELSINISSREMTEQNQQLTNTIQQLHKAQEELMRAERASTTGKISADVSHEINNPLAYVLSNIEILEKRFLTLVVAVDFYKGLIDSVPTKTLQEIQSEIIHFDNEKKIPRIIADSDPMIAEIKNGLHRIKEIIINLNKITGKTRNPVKTNGADFRSGKPT